MAQSLTRPFAQSASTPQPAAALAARATTSTRWLLATGLLTGPLFIGLAYLQVLTRPGFDLKRNAISLLTLGDLGWIQVANFLVSGALALLLAAGMRRAMHPSRGSTWGPLLIGGYGIGFMIGGTFTPDPSFGFPPGAPEGMAAVMSWHASLHAVGFMLAFLSVIPACFVFVRRYVERKQGRWALYSAASGLVAPALIVLGSSNLSIGGVLFFLAGVVVCAWLVVVSLGLLAETRRLAA